MFFTKHPYLTQTDNLGNTVQVTDIFANIKGFDNYKNSKYSLEYYIRDGDTPESISHRIYGKQSLSWLILLINNMKSYCTDWPMSSQTFDEYMKNKYGGMSSIFLKLDSIKNYDIPEKSIIVAQNNNNIEAEVVSWNASLSKLTIKQTKGEFSNNTNIKFKNTNTVLATIGRVNKYEQDALHHFESDGVYLDPLLGYLQSYISGVSNNVVTNYQYEMLENDKKRFIFIPIPSVANMIDKEYGNLMAS